MKFSEGPRATEGHGSFPPALDAELRKYGHRSVFDTLVVHTVNHGCWFGPARTQLTQSTSPGKQPQGRGPNEIGGSLLKRWSMWFNSTIHGAPYPPQCRPSSARTRPRRTAGQRRCMAVVSSCCEAWPWVAKRTPPTPPPPPPPRVWPGSGVRLRGGRARPPGESRGAGLPWQKSSQYGLHRRGHTRATRAGSTGCGGESPSHPPTPAPVRIARCKPRMKSKPLVIVHQDVTVKLNQALHTPPITLGKCVRWDPRTGRDAGLAGGIGGRAI